jgi:hypothetical protein
MKDLFEDYKQKFPKYLFLVDQWIIDLMEELNNTSSRGSQYLLEQEWMQQKTNALIEEKIQMLNNHKEIIENPDHHQNLIANFLEVSEKRFDAYLIEIYDDAQDE